MVSPVFPLMAGAQQVLNPAAPGIGTKNEKGQQHMNTITAKDGTQIYFNDWGTVNPSSLAMAGLLARTPFEDADVLFGLARVSLRRS